MPYVVCQGLVVPVMRNVEGMNYADIEKGIAALGQKAKNNQIAVEDMDGGTFTIRFELDIARSNSDLLTFQ